MKKYIIVTLISLMVILFFASCKQAEVKNENIALKISLVDYNIDNGIVVFNTQILLTNNTDVDRYILIKGDFEDEYKSDLIDTQVLTGFDALTGYEIFLVPADAEILFNVSFKAKHGTKSMKNDRLPPEITIEEVNEEEIDIDEVVTNIATKSDGTLIEN